ncbi:MAG TPA: DUF4270 domain-containing protein [Bacteroidia bacterium]
MNLKFVSLLFISFVLASSCKKQNDNVFLANEALQGFDGYMYTDTISLNTCTIREDSLRTDNLTHNTVGVINDPLFGTYSANSYAQFRLPQLGNVISSQTLDSVVLFLQFTSETAYYGDLNSTMDLSVYELNEKMDTFQRYSNGSYNYDPTPIGTFSGKFRVSDSMDYMDLGTAKKAAPGISIKLSNTFAQKLFNANSTDLSSQDQFINFFKGIAVVPTSNPSSGSGIIAALNFKGSYSRIRIYYNGNQQSDFQVIDESNRLTKFNISNQPFNILQQKSLNGKFNFDTTYIQAMTGAKLKIDIPYLFAMTPKNGKKMTIGKAEIIIRPLAGSYTSPFNLPSRLLLLQPDESTRINNFIEDITEPFYGGKYDAVKNEYRFNITRHIQQLFINYQNKGSNKNRGLYLLVPTDEPIAPSRMVIDARKKLKDAGIEFRLVYTEL